VGQGGWPIGTSLMLEVQISQAGFGYRRVNPVKEIGMCVEIRLEGKMNQPNSRGTHFDGGKSLAVAQEGRDCRDIIAIKTI